MKKMKLFLIAFVFFANLGIFPEHVSASVEKIVYPIAELGLCGNLEACQSYCDDLKHASACISYGESRGLMTTEESNRAQVMVGVLKNPGPGGCTNATSCAQYCDDPRHESECARVASQYELASPVRIERANARIEASMNPQVTSKCSTRDTCRQYCAEERNAEECLVLAVSSKMFTEREAGLARTFLQALALPNAPDCSDTTSCRKYCVMDIHRAECIGFFERIGIISHDTATILSSIQKNFPKNCTSRVSCAKFCNDRTSRASCLDFAVSSGLVSTTELQLINEGIGRLRTGLVGIPSEAVLCVQNILGVNALNDMASGDLVPSASYAKVIQECFVPFQSSIAEGVSTELAKASPESLSCLTEKIGKDAVLRLKKGEALLPNEADSYQACVAPPKRSSTTVVKSGWADMTPATQNCVAGKIGKERVQNIVSGKTPPDKIAGTAVKECMLGDSLYAPYASPEPERVSIPERVNQSPVNEGSNSLTPVVVSGGGGGGVPSLPPSAPKTEAGQTAELCAMFAIAPTCADVSADVRDLCKKCKGE